MAAAKPPDSSVVLSDVWVQCCDTECQKWRKLLDIHEPCVVPDQWVCEDNAGPTKNTCQSEEEEWLPDNDVHVKRYVSAQYAPGSVVVARCGKHWWPGLVDYDPDSKVFLSLLPDDVETVRQYHIVLFNRKLAWCAKEVVEKFDSRWLEPHRIQLGRGSRHSISERLITTSQQLNAFRLAVEVEKLPIEERLKKHGIMSLRYLPGSTSKTQASASQHHRRNIADSSYQHRASETQPQPARLQPCRSRVGVSESSALVLPSAESSPASPPAKITKPKALQAMKIGHPSLQQKAPTRGHLREETLGDSPEAAEFLSEILFDETYNSLMSRLKNTSILGSRQNNDQQKKRRGRPKKQKGVVMVGKKKNAVTMAKSLGSGNSDDGSTDDDNDTGDDRPSSKELGSDSKFGLRDIETCVVKAKPAAGFFPPKMVPATKLPSQIQKEPNVGENELQLPKCNQNESDGAGLAILQNAEVENVRGDNPSDAVARSVLPSVLETANDRPDGSQPEDDIAQLLPVKDGLLAPISTPVKACSLSVTTSTMSPQATAAVEPNIDLSDEEQDLRHMDSQAILSEVALKLAMDYAHFSQSQSQPMSAPLMKDVVSELPGGGVSPDGGGESPSLLSQRSDAATSSQKDRGSQAQAGVLSGGGFEMPAHLLQTPEMESPAGNILSHPAAEMPAPTAYTPRRSTNPPSTPSPKNYMSPQDARSFVMGVRRVVTPQSSQREFAVFASQPSSGTRGDWKRLGNPKPDQSPPFFNADAGQRSPGAYEDKRGQRLPLRDIVSATQMQPNEGSKLAAEKQSFAPRFKPVFKK